MSTARETAMAETKDELPVVAYAHFAENGNVRLWSPNMSNENLIALTETLGKSPVALCKFISAAAKIAELQQEVEGLRKEKARLDWLEGDGCSSVFKLGTRWYTRAGYGMPHHRAAGLRAAIDASLSAGRSGSGDGGMCE